MDKQVAVVPQNSVGGHAQPVFNIGHINGRVCRALPLMAVQLKKGDVTKVVFCTYAKGFCTPRGKLHGQLEGVEATKATMLEALRDPSGNPLVVGSMGFPLAKLKKVKTMPGFQGTSLTATLMNALWDMPHRSALLFILPHSLPSQRLFYEALGLWVNGKPRAGVRLSKLAQHQLSFPLESGMLALTEASDPMLDAQGITIDMSAVNPDAAPQYH